MKCKHCGNEIADGSKFCKRCGNKVTHTNHRLFFFVLFALLLVGGCIGVYYGIKNSKVPVGKVTITVDTNDSTMGTVNGGGRYDRNETVTIEAIVKEGYQFVEWNDANTDRLRKVVADHDQVYVARFDSIVTTVTTTPIEGSDTIDEVSDTNDDSEVSEIPVVPVTPVIPKFTITVKTDDPDMGTVKGGGEWDSLSVIKIEAQPKNGYQFVSWTDGNKSRIRKVKVLCNQEYTARFQKIENKPVETYNLEWGNYAGPMKGGKPDGRPGKVTVTRTYDIVDASGNTITVYPGETITATKFDNGHLKSGEIHRKDGSHLLFMAD